MITFVLVVAILLVVSVAFMLLAQYDAEEKHEETLAQREEMTNQYLANLRAKYNRRGLPMGFRRRIDFTGERPLAGAELEQVKREIMKV